MEPLTPSSAQIVDSSGAAAVRWSEFKQLYERYLGMYSQSLTERTEYNRLLREKLQLEREEAKQREHQAKRQARFQLWTFMLLLVLVFGIPLAIVLTSLFKK